MWIAALKRMVFRKKSNTKPAEYSPRMVTGDGRKRVVATAYLVREQKKIEEKTRKRLNSLRHTYYHDDTTQRTTKSHYQLCS